MSPTNPGRIATLILAAGNSSRLSEPKQLLESGGKTLLHRIAETALSLKVGPVFVVLGARAEQLQPELAGLLVSVVVNPDWQEGMASSLQTGLSVLNPTETDAFLVLLTDQPHVTTDRLQQLLEARQQTHKGIVASQYGEPGNLGVPALFDLRYKADFDRLTGDTGARKLIQQYLHDCVAVPFPEAAIDLDTPQDVFQWRSNAGN